MDKFKENAELWLLEVEFKNKFHIDVDGDATLWSDSDLDELWDWIVKKFDIKNKHKEEKCLEKKV